MLCTHTCNSINTTINKTTMYRLHCYWSGHWSGCSSTAGSDPGDCGCGLLQSQRSEVRVQHYYRALTFVVFPVLWTLTLRWKQKVREGVGGTWAPVVIHLLGWHWSLQCTNTLADMYTVHIVTISGLLFCPVQSPLWIIFKEGSQLLGYSIRC